NGREPGGIAARRMAASGGVRVGRAAQTVGAGRRSQASACVDVDLTDHMVRRTRRCREDPDDEHAGMIDFAARPHAIFVPFEWASGSFVFSLGRNQLHDERVTARVANLDGSRAPGDGDLRSRREEERQTVDEEAGPQFWLTEELAAIDWLVPELPFFA